MICVIFIFDYYSCLCFEGYVICSIKETDVREKTHTWSWRSLRKKHKLKYEFSKDNSLEQTIIRGFFGVRHYLASSILDLSDSLRKGAEHLWLALSLQITLLTAFHFNQSSILSVNLHNYISSFTAQFLIAIISFVLLYKIRALVNFLWLITGPDLRWMKMFLALELTTLTLATYSLVPNAPTHILNLACQLIAACATGVSVLGGMRQWRFTRRQRLLKERSQLIVDRTQPEHFNLSGQMGAALQLKDIINNEKDPETPVSVLVDGKWGDGKTYLVNHVIHELSQQNRDTVIIRFEPWRHVSEEAIVTSFYSMLGSELSKLPGSLGIQFDIADMSRKFVSKIDTTGTLESILTQSPLRQASHASFEKIEKLLTDTGKRIVLIIDDVERCGDKDRILRTLQLGLHLGSDIKNSTTIIIGDVQEVISKTEISESYLQKIIDEQITVLPPTNEEMLSVTNTLMRRMPIDIHITQDQRLDLLLRNIRGIKRALIGVQQDYLGVGNNIHPQDLFAINVIRHSFPTIYSDIMQNRRLYVPLQYKDYADEAFRLYGLSSDEEGSEFIKDQVEHFSNLIKNLKLSDIQRRRLISVLEEIFPATKSRFEGGQKPNNDVEFSKHRRERRIGVSLDYLNRYFLLSKDVDKRHLIEDSQAELRENYFDESDDEKRLQLLEPLLASDDKESEELFYGSLADSLADISRTDNNRKILSRDMLRLYFRNTKRLVRDDRRTLLIILNAINDYVDSEDYEYIFDGIETYMQHPSTGLRLLLYINPTRQNSFYDLKHYGGYSKLRQKILSKIDRYYLIQGHDIIEEDTTEEQEWRFTIAQWSTSVCYNNLEDFVDTRFKKVNAYLMAITKDTPHKFHSLLMGAFWHNNILSEKEGFTFNITPQAYDARRFAKQAQVLLKRDDIEDELRRDFHLFLREYNTTES